VWRWARKCYPATFPYSSKDFRTSTNSSVPDKLPTRLATLIGMIPEVAGRTQKQITATIAERLKVSDRDAQAFAALIRPDEAAARDGRVKARRRV